MPRAQTGITPLPPKNVLILSFSIEDLPLKAMSIGHIAANIPGLVNEIRESASGSDLLYSIGFGTLLWNFIWQAQHPPGFRPLEFEDENEIEEEDEDVTDGSDLTFCFFSSNPDLLDYLAEESQIHLKNIARVYDRVLANRVDGPNNNHPAGNEKTVVIGPEHPEFSQSSFLFTLGLAPAPQTNAKLSKADQESISQNLTKDFLSLTENETGLIHHLYACQTESERRHYLLALSNRVEPFQNILDAVVSPSDGSYQTHLGDMELTPTLHFLPSLEILAAFRMGTLRIGPLSPTAKWK